MGYRAQGLAGCIALLLRGFLVEGLMKIISHYGPPAPGALEALKNELGRTGRGIAELAALAGDNQWRKYTVGKQPRQVGVQLAFFMAARLELG